jgi:hypothetical protein
VRVHSNFSIHAVNEYEAGSGTHIRARTPLRFLRAAFPLRHPSASHTYVISNVQYLIVRVKYNEVYLEVGVFSNLVMSYLMLGT